MSNDAEALFKKERQECLLTRLFSWTGHGSGYLLVAVVKVVVCQSDDLGSNTWLKQSDWCAQFSALSICLE